MNKEHGYLPLQGESLSVEERGFLTDYWNGVGKIIANSGDSEELVNYRVYAFTYFLTRRARQDIEDGVHYTKPEEYLGKVKAIMGMEGVDEVVALAKLDWILRVVDVDELLVGITEEEIAETPKIMDRMLSDQPNVGSRMTIADL